MNIASTYFSKLAQGNRELEAGVRELDSVWRVESLTGLLASLRRALGTPAKSRPMSESLDR